ncbi:ATP-binding protein [Chitinimonas sp. JJ19]|uniref:ATP-binding protein n=1 Tax=Chitinimonas sp. JJ19 TaxID=3109352 RepID=UPI002FFFD457
MVTPACATVPMRELVQQMDWSRTPLGAMAHWPQSLQTLAELCLASRFPSVIFWGEERVQLYNDAYRVILGAKHPAALGQRAADCWSEIWHLIRDMMASVFDSGEAVWVEASPFSVERNGYLEEAYFTFSYTPARAEGGVVGGIFETVAEVTEQVISHRRLAALRELGEQLAAPGFDEACIQAAEVLSRHQHDLPFVLFYLLSDDGQTARLAAQANMVAGAAGAPLEISLSSTDGWAPGLALQGGQVQVLRDLAARFGHLPGGPWPESASTAAMLPLVRAGAGLPYGWLIAGISPRRALDEAYMDFLRLAAQHLSRVLGNVDAYQHERRRAEQLAMLDRAKTTFFNNVSHEFRTPLTLILGHVESALSEPGGTLDGDHLQATHRSAVRLLSLVNSLLDFARIESGRLQGRFAPTDLAGLTTGLAGSFQSLLEQAGLRLVVDCPALPEPLYVDAALWEKIVLNLLSNAFKFTWQGEIGVRLRWLGQGAELEVWDTGCGIPAAELPRMFERFHRVEGTRGRSFEGSGIGLSLVQEFVALHGGRVTVDSVEGQGSRFRVFLPSGRAHLPASQCQDEAWIPASDGKRAYLLDAATWLGQPAGGQAAVAALPAEAAPAQMARILVVDDNLDMRHYLSGILSAHWQISLAVDGEDALAQALAAPPDMVVSDVMMPRLDGVGLLRALRRASATAQIPVLLLSARAGEEPMLEGIDTGADDYMVKPFSTRELLARVRTHLGMAQRRRQWARELESVNAELESFSYSVSHDLRAPLRSIDGFSRALLSHAGDKLDAQEQHYLARVRTAAQQMGHLIDDLLNLAHITRQHVHRERVELAAVASRLLASLAERDPTRQVATTLAGSLPVQADARLVGILMENLLGNAWKFTAHRQAALIEVGATVSDGCPAFYVRDNGAGFDMRYASKLFSPFHRLHDDSEFSGTGIGLSIVQRIVTRHEGRVWAEATPGQGACFYFTLEAVA